MQAGPAVYAVLCTGVPSSRKPPSRPCRGVRGTRSRFRPRSQAAAEAVARSRRPRPRSLQSRRRHCPRSRPARWGRSAGRVGSQNRVPWPRQSSSRAATLRADRAVSADPTSGRPLPSGLRALGRPRQDYISRRAPRPPAPDSVSQDATRASRRWSLADAGGGGRPGRAGPAAAAGVPPAAGASRRPSRCGSPGGAGSRHHPQLRLPLPPPGGAVARLVRAGAGPVSRRQGSVPGTPGLWVGLCPLPEAPPKQPEFGLGAHTPTFARSAAAARPCLARPGGPCSPGRCWGGIPAVGSQGRVAISARPRGHRGSRDMVPRGDRGSGRRVWESMGCRLFFKQI